MRILIACEFSGIVREAFRSRGHDAWSCDILPSEISNHHYQCDVRELDLTQYNMMIAFPPCTHLASSGARWFKEKEKEQQAAIEFVVWLINQPIRRIAIENPVGVISRLGKPNQIIQPWQFGHAETKATCLWLKNLPLLRPTEIVEGRQPRVHMTGEQKERWKKRSRTLQGIADAMAMQWGNL